MKKYIALILAVVMIVPAVFCSCKSEQKKSTDKKADKGISVGVVYKQSGNPYFESSVKGFKKAADELGFTLLHDGPDDGSVEGQKKIIRKYIKKNVDVLCISANDEAKLADVCKEAKKKGIKVISWDAKLDSKSRDLDIAPASAELIGITQLESIAAQMGYEGQLGIVSTSKSSPNQNLWISIIKEALKNDEKYKDIELIGTVYGEDDATKSFDVCNRFIHEYPETDGIIALSATATPAVARCIADNLKAGEIKVTGLAISDDVAKYIQSGVIKEAFLWNPEQLGYVTAYAAFKMVNGGFSVKKDAVLTVPEFGELKVAKADDGGYILCLEKIDRIDAESIEKQ